MSKDEYCLVCGPEVLIDSCATLQKFIDLIRKHPRFKLSRPSVMHRGNNLYIQAPPVLEQMTRSTIQLPPFELRGKVPKDYTFKWYYNY